MHIIRSLCVAASLAALAHAGSIQFVQEGWSGGGRLTVRFDGADADRDGVIQQLELSLFDAVYTPPAGSNIAWGLVDIQPDAFFFTDLDNFLIFAANPTYSVVDTAFEGEALATIFDSQLFPIDSTSAPPAAEAPEPGGLAIPGAIVLLLLAARRRMNPHRHRWILSLCAAAALSCPAAFAQRDGRTLFQQETFGGNGRTCSTCHSQVNGTVSPQDAQRRFIANRLDPLFRHDGSDDGQGNGILRMLTEATVLVTLSLPSNVRLAQDPSARTVTLRRGIPSTLNTPALDTVLMLDGREPDLATQAGNAIRNHAQGSIPPDQAELDAIARFELTDPFFSSSPLRDFARGGPAPLLPAGTTDSEIRGRAFFEDRFDPGHPKLGACALCHSGPMLNRTNQFFIPPAGARFQSVAVSEFNSAKNPVQAFVFRNPDGSETTIASADPGRALITGDPRDANLFKIPSLWGVRHTAPYFHDNSARTLVDLVEHYSRLFVLIPNGFQMTPQDKADVVAYLKLLE
jgi:hypothetical protein